MGNQKPLWVIRSNNERSFEKETRAAISKLPTLSTNTSLRLLLFLRRLVLSASQML